MVTHYRKPVLQSRKQEKDFSLIPNSEWGEKVGQFLKDIIGAINATTMVIGTVGLVMADVVMGGLALSVIFVNPIPLLWFYIPPQVLGFFISFAFSAIQMFAWETVFNTNMRFFDGKLWAALIGGGIILILDTIIDTSVIDWLIHGTSPMNFSLTDKPMLYIVLALGIAFLTGFNEVLTVLFLRKYK